MADDDLGAALTGMLADFIHKRPAAGFSPSSPEGLDVPLNVSPLTYGTGRPGLRGDVELPDGMTASGSYRKWDEHSPAEWSAKVGLRRKF